MNSLSGITASIRTGLPPQRVEVGCNYLDGLSLKTEGDRLAELAAFLRLEIDQPSWNARFHNGLPFGEAGIEKFLDSCCKADALICIVRDKSNAMVGVIDLHRRAADDYVFAELGIVVASRRQHEGIGTSALKAVVADLRMRASDNDTWCDQIDARPGRGLDNVCKKLGFSPRDQDTMSLQISSKPRPINRNDPFGEFDDIRLQLDPEPDCRIF